MEELRHRLREITGNGRPDTHRQLIEGLKAQLPHSIAAVDGAADIRRYTCVMHAFDLVEDAEYVAIVRDIPSDIFASPDFLSWLIVRGHLLPRSDPGGVIVYKSDGAVTHIGKMLSNDRVESKWGIGHLYHHGIWEVPAQFGREMSFFQPIERDTAMEHFRRYVSERRKGAST